MKNSLYEKIKEKRLTEPHDIFMYICVVIILISFFLGIFLNKSQRLEGFKIETNNQVVFEFDFDKNTYNITNGYESFIIVNENSITVFVDQEKTEFNIVSFDVENKTVCVLDSTCSSTKDCVKSPKITNDKGVIICSPHKLKVLPLTNNISDTPITGA